jgi:hypothetical protein
MQKSTIILILFFALLGIGAYMLVGRFSVAISDENPAVRYEPEMASIRRLSSVALDTAVLNDPLFQSLLSPIIPDIPNPQPGRANPFVPF